MAITKESVTQTEGRTMTAREFVTVDLINNLRWTNIRLCHDIETNLHDKVGEVVTLLK